MPGPGQPTCMCGMAHNPHENGRSTLRTNFSTVSGLILGLRPTNERRRYNVTPSLIGWAQTKNQSYSLYDWQVTAGPARSHDAYPGWQRSLDSELYDLGLNLGIDKISIARSVQLRAVSKSNFSVATSLQHAVAISMFTYTCVGKFSHHLFI